jgi:hypothetical protein
MKVPGNVGLGFGRADFPSSRDVDFAAPECRLVRASNSITVIGAQKCSSYSCLLSMRLRTSLAEYNASVRRCATMAQAGGGVGGESQKKRPGRPATSRNLPPKSPMKANILSTGRGSRPLRLPQSSSRPVTLTTDRKGPYDVSR